MVSLRFRARGGLVFPQIGALDASPRRFVGRRFDESLASKGIAGGWPAMPAGEEISVHEHHMADYRKAVAEGALWPADEKTAAMMGAAFDPHFGGEFGHDAPASHDDDAHHDDDR